MIYLIHDLMKEVYLLTMAFLMLNEFIKQRIIFDNFAMNCWIAAICKQTNFVMMQCYL